jgi:hypothetical protein
MGKNFDKNDKKRSFKSLAVWEFGGGLAAGRLSDGKTLKLLVSEKQLWLEFI